MCHPSTGKSPVKLCHGSVHRHVQTPGLQEKCPGPLFPAPVRRYVNVMDDIVEIDALGLMCPLPVIKLQKALKPLETGQMVRVLADDPVATIDIPHFCNMAGHAFLDETELDMELPGHGRVARAFTLRVG